MDNLQYLHNTLLEYKLLDKSFEEFKAASSDKSYQQKVFQETSNRGMFDGSFIDFQNKYFPTQAATITPPTATTTPTSKSKKKEEEITVSEQEENDARETSIDSDFWKNQKYKREDYYQEDGKWFYKNPKTSKIAEITKGDRFNELNSEEARYKNNLVKIRGEKEIKEKGLSLDQKPDRKDLNEDGTPKYWKKDGTLDVDKLKKDVNDFETARKRITSAIVDENVLETKRKVQEITSDYNKKKGDLTLKINRAKENLENAKDENKENYQKKIEKYQKELNALNEDREGKINGVGEEERKRRGFENMPEVTKELTELDDSESLELFYDRYKKYGFEFSVGIWEGDKITVESQVDLDGDGEFDKETFDVDQGSIFDNDKANSKVAKDMDEWMRKRAIDLGGTVEGLYYTSTLNKEEKEVKNEEARQEINGYYLNKPGLFKEDFIDHHDEIPSNKENSYEGKGLKIIQKFAERYKLSEEEVRAYFYNQYGNKYDLMSRSELDAQFGEDRKGRGTPVPGNRITGEAPYYKPISGYDIDGIDDFERKYNNGIDKKFRGVVKNEDIALQNLAFQRIQEEQPNLKGLSYEQIAKTSGDRINEIIEEIRQEWQEVSDVSSEDFDQDIMKSHPMYNQLKGIHGNEAVSNEVKKRVTEEIEGMGGSEWFGAFARGESQEKLAEEVEGEVEEYQARIDYIKNSSEVLSRELEKIKGDGETYGLEYEAKWLQTNGKAIKNKIQEIQNRKFTSQEEVDAANVEISSLLEEFNTHYDRYENMIQNQSALAETAVSLQLEAQDVLKKEDDLKLIVDVLKRNHQWGTQVVNSLGHASIDLLQGLATSAEAFFYYANPFGRLGDYLVESGVIENEVLKTFVEVGQYATGVGDASERFDDDATTTSYSEWIHGKIDGWQESNKALVQEPPSFDDIEDFSDFGEWFGVMLGNQAPQLALMFATGGQSTWVQGTLMAATAGGQKFMGMEEQKKLYEETSGLYGNNFGIDQIFWSSAAVGLAESLSERVTFGQIKGVNRLLKTNPAVREGFTKNFRDMITFGDKLKFGKEYLRDVVLTKDYAKFVGKGVFDLAEEGSSEVLATMSENVIDIMNGEDVGIFDNIAESFISGALISQTIKSPIIFNQMYAPFASPDNKSLIDEADRKIKELSNLISTGRPGKNATREEIEKWEVQEAKYIEEILKLGQDKMKAIAHDVKRVNAMDSPQGNKDKRELLDIHKDQRKIEREYNEVKNDKDINEGVRSVRLKELQNQYNTNNIRKGNILGKYTPDIVDRRYEKDVESARQRAEELKELDGTQVDIQEGNDRNFLDWLMSNDGYEVLRDDAGEMIGVKLDEKTIKGLKKQNQEILDNEKSSEQDIYQAEQNIKMLNDVSRATEGRQDLGFLSMDRFKRLTGQSMNYGGQLTEFDDNGDMKSQKIFINKARSLDAGKFYTATHELLHGILFQTLKRDPDTQEALGNAVLTALNNKGVVIPPKLQARIDQYSKQEGKGEEIMTLLSEAIREGDVKLPGQSLRVLKNFFRGLFQRDTNRDISFDTDEDVINFLGNYSYSMKYNKENKAITRMWSEGAGGKLIEDAKAKYNAKVKKNKPTVGEVNFAKNVDQELNNNPDLLTEIDAFVKNEDGTPKYTDKSVWQTSTDFVDAWQLITQSKKLDGLIQAGMVAEGVNTPEALRDFTRKVKDELGERLLKNFDPAKNDSLFGWLTGVSGGMGKSIIYRAKGDVMNKYSKEIKAVSIDRGMTTEGGDTFSSQIEGEVDTEMERLETEDLTIGEKTVKKSDIDVIFLESVNTDKRIVEAINGIIDSSGVNLEGLTYNGTKKNIIQHDGGKPKSKRKPVGKLYKVLDLVSKEFGVDSMRIIKEQDLTNAQRVEAREYIENNAEKLIDMLPEGENRSGDATGVANTVLGEFYIEGDRISMAESGTGKGKKSQTKRTDITKKEFIEFFNKPGTKSDGAIRALIVQAATISANQAIRLNAINKSTDPMSTIALVGDGKSAIMFSKDDRKLQPLGAIDRTLSKYPEAKSDFWANIRVFVDQNILSTSLKSIKTALENTYPEKQFPEIYENIDQIARSIQPVIKSVKTPKKFTDKVAEQLVKKLVVTNQNQYIKVKEALGSDTTASATFLIPQRVKEYVATTTELAQGMFDPNNLEESVAMIYSLKGHLATMGKGYLKRKQPFRTTEEFLENTLGKIDGITYTLTKSGGLDTVTWTDPSNKNAKPVEFKPADILSQQNSSAALADIEAYEKGDTERFDKRGKNEDIAQKTLNYVVKFYSDKFNNKEIDNVDLMMVASSLLSGMDSILGRSGKVNWISDEARAEIKRAKKAELTELKPETKLLKEGAYDSELDPEAQDALFEQLKEDAQAKVRYEHAPQRVAVVISMFHENINGNGINDIKEFLKEFQVQIVTHEHDNVINDAKYGSALPENTNINTPNILLIRNYNDRTKNDPRIESVKKIRREGNETFLDKDGYVIQAEAFKMSGKIINKNLENTTNFSKAVNQANTIDENTPSRGMSAWDFDDTLATTKSGVRARIPNPDGTPKPKRKVIFLAGGAGSGKSNVVKKLGLEKSGFKVVNSDISLEWLKKNSGLPENMNDLTKEQRSTLGKLQHQSRGIAKRKMMKYQGNGDGIVVDGTGGSLNVMKKQVQEYRDAGYDVQMIFVETSLDTALERNKNRKERSLLDIIVRKNHHAVQGNKEAFKELFGDNFAEVSTDNLTMKSPMPKTLVDKVNNFTNSYENRRLDAEEFATEGASILEQGGEFDFSEFNVVTEGAQGPMFKTAMDRAKKFGTEHTYVLTARPPEAAIPIQEFLKSQGLDIPLENITGLGNSTGEAKAEWMLEKFAEGYNDMYFADDAMQNVEAVKYVLDQLDIKSEVIQAKIQFSKSIKPNTEILLEGLNTSQTNSINKVKDIETLTGEGVYNNIMFSKKHRGEYENLISKNRPDLVKEGLVSQTVDAMFNYIDGLDIPADKKRKYEKITTKWLATSNIKLNEDSYKIKDAVELAEKHKEDIFSYDNPNGIIEKYAGKAKAKPTNPNKVEEFGKGMIINGKYNIVAYEVQDTKEGMHAVREVVDTHFGPKSNPWCIISRSDEQALREQYVGPEVVFGKQKAEARKKQLESEGFRVELKNEPVDLLVPGKEGPIANRYKLRKWKPTEDGPDIMDDAWSNWMVYRDGPKRIIFQDGKLISFYANDQYWDRMDKDTDHVVITRKKGNLTEKVELVPTGQLGQVQEFVRERRIVSQDKNTVKTEDLVAGDYKIENRVNGQTVKETEYRPDGTKYNETNFKNGKKVSYKSFYPNGNLLSINTYGQPFGEMSKDEIVKTKGDIIESMGTAYNVREAWHAEVLFKGKVAEVGIEIGKDVKIDDLLKTSPNGEIRLDLNKVLEADINARFMIPGQTPTTLAGALGGNVQFSKKESDLFNLGEIINSNIEKELDLNRVLEQTKGVKAEARYSDAQAKVQGSKKNPWWKFFVPPSAEDFRGLIYRFVGKGRIGEQQMAFFKKTLFDPFARAYEAMNNSKQRLEGEYRALLKEFPNVKKLLNEVVYNNFTLGQMIRVYNWNKAGFEIPGLSQRDLDAIIKAVEGDAETLAFANSLSTISNQEAGYTEPGDYWMVENIQSDINKINNELDRAYHLREWKQNITKMFGDWKGGKLDGPNMNKIEAIFGTQFREALEDMIWRMEFGTKRQQGGNRLVNRFNNWANQSVGAIMFFNMRSALLQTISSINYINWTDNNPLKAGLALLNVPQFVKDFTMIFNSDMLKQRRAGNQRGINEAELAEAVAGNKFSPKAIINWLLTKGFLPTQIADSFAIASGGATFYRNRVNSLLKQGYTQEQAESRAWNDFQENTEESQQSSRPDMISQQQASPLGRYILAFKNTPMQYARLTKKAWLDLINGRGDAKTNISKIIYYMGVQNLIFSGLQAALGALIGDDDEEKDAKTHERVVNSMIDSILGGLGFGGNAVLTMKNMILEYNKQNKKGWNADHTYTILKFFSFSPTIGSKGRKLYGSIQTEQYNKDVIKEMSMLDIDNPRWSSIANLISAITNVPLDRLVKKIDNIDAAITEDITATQRFALLMGWNTWDLGIDDSDILAVEDEIKEKKQADREEKKKIKEEEKKKKEEEENKAKEEENKKKDDDICIAIGKSGKRCKKKAEAGGYCTVHAKVEQGTEQVQCKKIKSDGTRCKMKTKAKSGYCYYHD